MMEKFEDDIDYLRQENKVNSLVINGISEKNSSDSFSEVKTIIEKAISIDISKKDLDYYYRLGKKSDSPENQTRPVVVRFLNRWLRDAVFKSKKNLKGTGFVVSEFLTNKKLMLLKKVRESVGVTNCWTLNGKIYALIGNNKKQIRSEHDLNK